MNAEDSSPLLDVLSLLRSVDRCRAYLESVRWPRGVRCPRCESEIVRRVKTRHQYDCALCNYRFSAMSGTIFHDSHVPLTTWFMAILLMIGSENGISANQVSRRLELSYKTAWSLCHRIRSAMRDAYPFPAGDKGRFDKIWGDRRGNAADPRGRGRKSTIVGVVSSGGKIYLQAARGHDPAGVHTVIRRAAHKTVESIHTEDWGSATRITGASIRFSRPKRALDARRRRAAASTTVENDGPRIKRQMLRTYRTLSAKHLNAYLAESAWRLNQQENPTVFRDTVSRLLESDRMTYHGLVGKRTASNRKVRQKGPKRIS